MIDAVVHGFYSKNNCGDDSYKLAFSELFDKKFKFTDKVELEDYTINNWVLGGGSVSADEFLVPFKTYNKNKLALSISLDKNCDLNIFKDFQQIFVRDLYSEIIALKNNLNVTYCPDFTFCLQGYKNIGKELIKKLFKDNNLELKDKVIIFAGNSHILYPNHPRTERKEISFLYFCNEISEFIDNLEDTSVIYLPFSTNNNIDDRTINSWIHSKTKWKQKNLCLYDKLNIQDYLNIIAGSDGLIGMRLHSCIFAAINNIPFISIYPNRKIKDFSETIENGYYLNYDKFNTDMLNRIYNNSIKSKYFCETINENVDKQKAFLYEIIKEIKLI